MFNFLRKKHFNGFTADTAKELQLDAGAFFKNFKVGEDTYASAKAAGKLLGATSGGGEFSAKPAHKRVTIDGVPERTKGLDFIDDWEIYIKATVVNIISSVIRAALGAAKTGEKTVEGYEHIQGKGDVSDEDYIDNITWVGNITGQEKPIIIQVYNGLNEDGLTFKVADKDNGKVDLTFHAYYSHEDVAAAGDETDLTPPFDIWEPVSENEEGGGDSTPETYTEEQLEGMTAEELYAILIVLDPDTELTAESDTADLIAAILAAQENE